MKTENVKKNPLSTFIGILFIGAGFIFQFVETLQETPLSLIIGCWVGGVLLLFAKDKLIDLLTLGVSSLIEKLIIKKEKGCEHPEHKK